jgi:dTDP-4-dehydrorhamnose 3,5-epimerase
MKIIKCNLEGVLLIEPDIFSDKRGFFCESFSMGKYRELGVNFDFVQDNVSKSSAKILRGLHYQIAPCAQAKLVSVIEGEIFDVAVDIRRSSPTFGKWFGARLAGPFRKQMLIPPGFAHGLCVLGESATLSYKCSSHYSPKHERGIRWNDPALGIEWPIEDPIVIERDASFPPLEMQKDVFE